jgi:hypothetical protein
MKFLIRESQLENVAEKFKPLLFKYWNKNGPSLTFKMLKMFGLDMKTSYELNSYFKDYLIEWFGGFDKFKEKVESFKGQIFRATDGGYNFRFEIFNVHLIDEDSVSFDIQILPGGTVTLIFYENPPTQRLEDAYASEDIGWEIRSEVGEIIFAILNPKFGSLGLEIQDIDVDFK